MTLANLTHFKLPEVRAGFIVFPRKVSPWYDRYFTSTGSLLGDRQGKGWQIGLVQHNYSNLALLGLCSSSVVTQRSQAPERMEVWKHYIPSGFSVRQISVISSASFVVHKKLKWRFGEITDYRWEPHSCSGTGKAQNAKALENHVVSVHRPCLWILPP